MGDRIRYAVGNTPIRDCQNWPTILRSEIDGIFGALTEDQRDVLWPVEITAPQIMALAWRVKKWKLYGTAEASFAYFDPGITQTITADGASEISDTDVYLLTDGYVAATTEADIVKRLFPPDARYQALVNNGIGAPDGVAPVSDWTIDGASDTGGPPTPFSESGSTSPADFNSLISAIFGTFVLFEPGDLFSPPFTGLGQLIQGSSRMLFSATFDKNPETVLAGSGPFSLKAPATLTVIPGIAANFDVPIELAWRPSGMAVGSSTTGTGTGEFFLEAVEFWPYENSLGQPVWDSANGSQINNPFG